MVSNRHAPSNHMQSGLDILAHQIQYGLQQIQQSVHVCQNSQIHRKGQNSKYHQNPCNEAGLASANDSGPIRRRVSLACDQCNQQRTKCDGQSPCAHCSNFDFGCTYVRKRKKRGKVSRKELAQRAAAAANGRNFPTDQALDKNSPMGSSNMDGSSIAPSGNNTSDFQQPPTSRTLSLTSMELIDENPAIKQSEERLEAGSPEGHGEISDSHQRHIADLLQFDSIESPMSLNLDQYSIISEYRPVLYLQMMECNNQSTFNTAQMNVSGYATSTCTIQAQDRTQGPFYSGDSTSPGFPIRSDFASSDEWITLCSTSHQYPKYNHFDATYRRQNSKFG